MRVRSTSFFARFALLAVISATAALAATLAADTAWADGDDRGGGGDKEERAFEVHIEKREVTVTAKGEWHINKDYPWKLVIGDTKLDRTKFELDEKTAKVHGAPAGTGKLRGAVCSKDVCRTLEREVTIP